MGYDSISNIAELAWKAKKMSIIKSLLDRLDRIKLIHEKKNGDYASSSNPFDNFERSGEIASWFDDPTHKAFANLIGTKLARLATLLNKKTAPNNESVQDSFDDLTTYCALFGSYVESKTAKVDSGLASGKYCAACLGKFGEGEMAVIDHTTKMLYHPFCASIPKLVP